MRDVSSMIDSTSIPSGPSFARSGSPGYTALAAMIAAGDATPLGDQYFTDGSVVLMADVGGRPTARNPEEMHLIIDPGYFERAEQEYTTPWKMVWWREAIQNAVDAGAKHLTLSVNEGKDTDHLVEVACEDDGSGMDKDTLQFKFLALGGTTKGQAGQIGGFGVAKKILCFRWPKWEIHTREHLLSSTDGRMEYATAPYRSGTLLRVWMPKESGMYTRSDIAGDFLERCNLSGVSATIDGDAWRGRWLPNGRPVRILTGDRADAQVYYTKESRRLAGECYIRTSEGLFMHDRYVSSAIKGYVIIELRAKVNPATGKPYPSRDFLAANRDDLTDLRLKEEIAKFLNELAADTTSGLKSKGGKVQTFIGASGRFQADIKALHSTVVYNMETSGNAKTGLALTAESIKAIAGLLTASGELNQELAFELLKAKYSGQNQVETALFHISGGYWRRDFMLYPAPELEGFTVPKRFHPEHQTPAIHKLARIWADFCLYVMVALNCRKPFGVGWIFDKDSEAAHHEDEHGDWLLLNPYIVNKKILKAEGGGDDLPSNLKDHPEWSVVNREHLRAIFALAIHECTHFVDGISYHGEEFSSALTYNTALAGPGFTMLERIAKASRSAARRERGSDATPPPPPPHHPELNKIVAELADVLPKGAVPVKLTPPTSSDEMSRITEEVNAAPELDLLTGPGYVVVREPSGATRFIYRRQDGELDSFPLTTSIDYWELVGRYGKLYPTITLVATCRMVDALRAYAAVKGVWKTADAPDDFEGVVKAYSALKTRLRAELSAYQEEYEWTAAGFRDFDRTDFRMAYRLNAALATPSYSMMTGAGVRLEEAIPLLGSKVKDGYYNKLANSPEFGRDEAGRPAFYTVESWGVPIPDRRHGGALDIVVARNGMAAVTLSDTEVRFITPSVKFSARNTPEAYALTLLDPVAYGTLVLALQGNLSAAHKFHTFRMALEISAWPGTAPADSPSDYIGGLMWKEILSQLEYLKRNPSDTASYEDVKGAVLAEVSKAGVLMK